MGYRRRDCEPVVRRAARQFPALIVTGPRQSGKTTLLRRLFRAHTYVSLDNLLARNQALSDPELFLAAHPPPLVIDEIQYAPNLLPVIKQHIDAHRQRRGQFIMTGSQCFPLMAGVTESLAGRAAVLTLLPFSLREAGLTGNVTLSRLQRLLLHGTYPEPVLHPRWDAGMWYTSHIQNYLERDVRQLRAIGAFSDFQRFLQLLASLNGQVLNYSTLAGDLGVAVNTVRNWLSVLEASHQIVLLKPYFRNRGKRLVKSPKLYFIDPGLVCHLTALQAPRQVLAGTAGGALMEQLVATEILKWFHNNGALPHLYWWRTSNGEEVDFVVEQGGRLLPIEVKLAATVKPGMLKGLQSFMRVWPDCAPEGYVVNLGTSAQTVARGIRAINLAGVGKLLQKIRLNNQ